MYYVIIAFEKTDPFFPPPSQKKKETNLICILLLRVMNEQLMKSYLYKIISYYSAPPMV
jgi:hypothetical protein